MEEANRQVRLSSVRAGTRLLTTIAIVGICALSVARGLSIVHFSLSVAKVSSSESRAEALETWTAAPGIASAALLTELTAKIDPSDLKAVGSRREVLSAILSIKPLSPADWLLLCGMQLITDQPMEQVLNALMLSIVTGPNEGYVMADRGTLGASLWEDLSPDLRRRAAMDLAAGEMPDNRRFRAVFSTKSEGVQSELRTAILATGISPKEVERLGF